MISIHSPSSLSNNGYLTLRVLKLGGMEANPVMNRFFNKLTPVGTLVILKSALLGVHKRTNARHSRASSQGNKMKLPEIDKQAHFLAGFGIAAMAMPFGMVEAMAARGCCRI